MVGPAPPDGCRVCCIAERGIEVDHVTLYRWVRQGRRVVAYVYREVDQHGHDAEHRLTDER